MKKLFLVGLLFALFTTGCWEVVEKGKGYALYKETKEGYTCAWCGREWHYVGGCSYCGHKFGKPYSTTDYKVEIRTNEPEMLFEIAMTASNTRVWVAAIRKLKDKQLLERIVRESKERDTRSCASRQLGKLNGEKILAEIAMAEDLDDETRIDAMSGLNDQELLAKIATTEDNPVKVRQVAIRRLNDRQLLERIRTRGDNMAIRNTAAATLERINK